MSMSGSQILVSNTIPHWKEPELLWEATDSRAGEM